MRDAVRVLRPKVSLAVAAGSLFGALYRGAGEPLAVAGAVAGAFLLCGGCSALNQVQERRRDRCMLRTEDRPVASGRMSASRGVRIAIGAGLAGLLLFFLSGGWPLLVLGLLVLAVYNGAYTLLKPVTPVALLAGGVAGAVPPLAGWLAAGGSVTDPRILSVIIIFYLWQVPHFWLLAEKHRTDYERAGFAMLHGSLSPVSGARLMGVWVAAYFLGLGILAGLAGPDALRWLVPPAMLLAGGIAVGLSLAGRWRVASVAMHLSLPVGLAPLLLGGL